MRIFVNDMIFDVYFVPAGCDCLKDSMGFEHLGMTDLDDCIVCIRDDLSLKKTIEVLQHELSHCYSAAIGYPISVDFDEKMAFFNGNYSDDIYLTSQDVLHYYGYE